MELRHMRYFMALARYRNFTHAMLQGTVPVTRHKDATAIPLLSAATLASKVK